MNLQITEQKKNALLSRKEINATLSYDLVTPSKVELKKQLGSAMKVEPGLVVIKHIYTGYGTRRADVIFYVYDSADALKKVEREKKQKKKAPEEKAK